MTASVQAYRIRFVFISFFLDTTLGLAARILAPAEVGRLGSALLSVMYCVGLLDCDERRFLPRYGPDSVTEVKCTYIYMSISQCNGTLFF